MKIVERGDIAIEEDGSIDFVGYVFDTEGRDFDILEAERLVRQDVATMMTSTTNAEIKARGGRLN